MILYAEHDEESGYSLSIRYDLDGFVYARLNGELCGPYHTKAEALADLKPDEYPKGDE